MSKYLVIISVVLLASCKQSQYFDDCPFYGVTYDDINSVRVWYAIDWCKVEKGKYKGITVKQYDFIDSIPLMPKRLERKVNR